MSAKTHQVGAWRAWAGLVGSPGAWAVHHQLGSDLNFTDCRLGNGPLVIAVGLGALVLTVSSGLLSWSSWRTPAASAPPSHRFIAALSLMACGLFSLSIIFQMLAAVILPACFR